MHPTLSDFLTWFRIDNMFSADRASDEHVINEVKRYAHGSYSLECALIDDLFGETGYLV